MGFLAGVVGALIAVSFLEGNWQLGLLLTAIVVVYHAVWWYAIEADSYHSRYGAWPWQ